jgi:threonine dehydrogenase-like Zn-dependent dehydrogenase
MGQAGSWDEWEDYAMPMPEGVKTSPDYIIPETMKAWVLGDPGQLTLADKPVPAPSRAEVLVRIDAVAICATDLEIIHHGPPALIRGGPPFNKGFTPGHEYMGTVVALGPGVDEYRIGERVTVEIHAGCGQCKRCREGMYTACHNYGKNYGDVNKGHRANGFTTDGGFCEYQVNNINTLVHVDDAMSDEEATLVVTAGTAMYGLTELGGLVAGESVVVTGPGPIGLLGGKICLAAFPHEAPPVDVAHIVRNNIYLYGIRGEGKSATHRAEAFMRQKRFDATLIHTHTFAMKDLPEALRYAKDRVEDAIKVVVRNEHASDQRKAIAAE